jgi:hypothetical protein
LPEEDFELIDDYNNSSNGNEANEDKSRKVMYILQRSDQVQQVFNISKIIGLEAVEALLILRRDLLYIIDNVF